MHSLINDTLMILILILFLLEQFLLWNKRIPLLDKCQLVVFRTERVVHGIPNNLFEIAEDSQRQYNALPNVYVFGARVPRRFVYKIDPASETIFLRSRFEWTRFHWPEPHGFIGRIVFEKKHDEIVMNITASLYSSFLFAIAIALITDFWFGLVGGAIFMSFFLIFVRNAFCDQLEEVTSMIQKNMQKSIDSKDKPSDY